MSGLNVNVHDKSTKQMTESVNGAPITGENTGRELKAFVCSRAD